MIKKLLKVIFLSIVCHAAGVGSALAQDVLDFDTRITYNLRYLGDSTDADTWRSERGYLFVSDTLSFYETANLHEADSARYIAQTKDFRGKMTYFYYKILKAGGTTRVYDNLFIRNWAEANFYYEEAIDDLDWILTQDTVHVNDRVCQVARLHYGNREWIAYFDPEIPLSDGPYTFGGLPGLIVQIRDTAGHWNFEMVGIERGQHFQCTLLPSKVSKPIEKEEFFAQKKYTDENAFEIQDARVSRTSRQMADPETRKKIRESIKKRLAKGVKSRSNWIELYP